MRWAVLTSILSVAIVVVVTLLCAGAGPKSVPSFMSPAVTGLRRLVFRQAGGDNSDVRVWVNGHSGLYYCPKTRLYGEIKPGSYMLQKDAIEHGYRPALGEACRPE